MSELAAAFLLVLGATIALIAAIGVARLPDAFMRMHAATKAGVVGAGLMLLGAGLAFDSADAWLRVGLIVLFLLVTVPIASHALGRAAYIGGAPLMQGSGEDTLAGVLPRHSIDHGPMRAGPQPAPAVSFPIKPASHPRRILLALAQGEGSDRALLSGLDACAAPGTEVTLLGLLCAPSLSRTGPVPLGGSHYAKRLVEKRMATARDGAAELSARLQSACEARDLEFSVRHEEGDALLLLEHAAADHDVTILPRGAWFDQAQVLQPGQAEARARAIAAPGLLIIGDDFETPRQLHFLHEGDAASGEALKRLLAACHFDDLPLTISALDLPGAAGTLADAVALASARGRQTGTGHRLLNPDQAVPAASFGGPVLGVISAHSAAVSVPWRRLREGIGSVLLA